MTSSADEEEFPKFIHGITTTAIKFVMFVVENYYESLFRMYTRYLLRLHEPNRAAVSPSFVLWLAVALSQEPGPRPRPGLSKFGLDPSVIAALPIFEFCVGKPAQGNTNETADDLECSVCLSAFDDGEKVRILPNCGHSFHAECIDKWLVLNTTCPVCRARVTPMLQYVPR